MSQRFLAQSWVQQVRKFAQEDLPDHVWLGVLSCGDWTIDLLEDLLQEEQATSTRLAEHAVALLGELRSGGSSSVLAELVQRRPEYGPQVHGALMKMGDSALPGLVFHMVLSGTGVVDAALALVLGEDLSSFPELRKWRLRKDPTLILDLLCERREPRFVPALLAALEVYDVREPGDEDRIVQTVRCIEALGGDPGDQGRHKLALAMEPGGWLGSNVPRSY